MPRWSSLPGNKRAAERVVGHLTTGRRHSDLTGEDALVLGLAYFDIGKRRLARRWLRRAAEDPDPAVALRAEHRLARRTAERKRLRRHLLNSPVPGLEEVMIQIAQAGAAAREVGSLLERVAREGGAPWRIEAALSLAQVRATTQPDGLDWAIDLVSVDPTEHETDDYVAGLVELARGCATECAVAREALLERALSLDSSPAAWQAARELARLRHEQGAYSEAEILWRTSRTLWRRRSPVGPGHDVALLAPIKDHGTWSIRGGSPISPGCGDEVRPFLDRFELDRQQVFSGPTSRHALVLVPVPPLTEAATPLAVLGDFANLLAVDGDSLKHFQDLNAAIGAADSKAAAQVLTMMAGKPGPPAATETAWRWAQRSFPELEAFGPSPSGWTLAEHAARQVQQLLEEDRARAPHPVELRDTLYEIAPGLGPALTGVLESTRAGNPSEQLRWLAKLVGAMSNFDLDTLPTGAVPVQFRLMLQRLNASLSRVEALSSSQVLVRGRAGLLGVRLGGPPEPDADTRVHQDIGALSKACRDLFGVGAITDLSFMLDDREREVITCFAEAMESKGPPAVADQPLMRPGTVNWEWSVALSCAALLLLGEGRVVDGWHFLELAEAHLVEAERRGARQNWAHWKNILSEAIRFSLRFASEVPAPALDIARRASAPPAQASRFDEAAMQILSAALLWAEGASGEALAVLSTQLSEYPRNGRVRALIRECATAGNHEAQAVDALLTAAVSAQVRPEAIMSDAATLVLNLIADGHESSITLRRFLATLASLDSEVRDAIEERLLRAAAKDTSDRTWLGLSTELHSNPAWELPVLMALLGPADNEAVARIAPTLTEDSLYLSTKLLLRLGARNNQRWARERAQVLVGSANMGRRQMWLIRAEVVLLNRDVDSARALMSESGSGSAPNETIAATRARLLMLLGEATRASQTMYEIASRAEAAGKSPSPYALAITAQAAVAARDWPAARTINERLVARQASNPTPWYWLGRIALAEGDKRAAVNSWMKALGLQARSPVADARRRAPLTATSLARLLGETGSVDASTFGTAFRDLGADGQRLLLRAMRSAPPPPDALLAVIKGNRDKRLAGLTAQVLSARLIDHLVRNGPTMPIRDEAREALAWARERGVTAELIAGAPAAYPRILLRAAADDVQPKLLDPDKLMKVEERLARSVSPDLVRLLTRPQDKPDAPRLFREVRQQLARGAIREHDLIELWLRAVRVRASRLHQQHFAHEAVPVLAVRRMADLVAVAGEDGLSLGVVVDSDVLRSVLADRDRVRLWRLDGDEYRTALDRPVGETEVAWLARAGVLVQGGDFVVRCLVEADDSPIATDAEDQLLVEGVDDLEDAFA